MTMTKTATSPAVRATLQAGVSLLLTAGCGFWTTACGSADPPPAGTDQGSSGSRASSGAASSGGGGSGGSSQSSGSSSGSGAASGLETDDGGAAADSDGGSLDAAEAGESDDGGGAEAATTEAGTCVKGQVQPSEVVMLGDSYLDPNWGNVGPTLMQVAGAMYRPYYLGGASINGGNGQFNIPYQFDSMAVPDNPDIKVVITDGGGNDLLLNNRQCLTTPVMGDTSCHMIIQGVLATAQSMLADMASKGVQHIVYLFYPHIDATTIYTGPDSNDWLDYAYPLAANICCGPATPASGDLTCHGSTTPGVDCTFVDTRPEFVGHNDPSMPSDYWLDTFGIHPNKQGAGVIAQKMWAQMQKYCIAQ
jgi:hypothetical protein